MNILHVKSIKLTYNLYVRYGFWRFLPFFKSLFAITTDTQDLGKIYLFYV